MTAIWYYWNSRTSLQKALHYLLLAIVLAILIIGMVTSPASADAPYGYKDEIRNEPTSLSRRPHVRDFLTAQERRELRRIHARASARMEGRVFRHPPKNLRRVAAYRDEPLPVRYVERRRAPESLYSRVSDKRCQPAIKAVSEERGWESRALRDAISKWRAAAIAEHGYAYGQYNSAKADRPDCGPIRTNKFGKDIFVCIVRARPCKDL